MCVKDFKINKDENLILMDCLKREIRRIQKLQSVEMYETKADGNLITEFYLKYIKQLAEMRSKSWGSMNRIMDL